MLRFYDFKRHHVRKLVDDLKTLKRSYSDDMGINKAYSLISKKFKKKAKVKD